MRRSWGITYQSGGLFSALSLAEYVAQTKQLYTDFTPAEIAEFVAYKLALVGLDC